MCDALQRQEGNVRAELKVGKRWLVALALLTFGIGVAALFSPRLVSGNESDDKTIARGGGTTIIHGGTGSPGFVPVITTIAFHASGSGNSATGSFECLAEAPEPGTGSKSARFTVNAMYVTGQITGARVHGDTATLTGTANITGLGAGSDVPFTFVVEKGGPGATSILTCDSIPRDSLARVVRCSRRKLERLRKRHSPGMGLTITSAKKRNSSEVHWSSSVASLRISRAELSRKGCR